MKKGIIVADLVMVILVASVTVISIIAAVWMVKDIIEPQVSTDIVSDAGEYRANINHYQILQFRDLAEEAGIRLHLNGEPHDKMIEISEKALKGMPRAYDYDIRYSTRKMDIDQRDKGSTPYYSEFNIPSPLNYKVVSELSIGPSQPGIETNPDMLLAFGEKG